MSSPKKQNCPCEWETGHIVRYQYDTGKQNIVRLTYCRNPENFGYPIAMPVIAESCCPYPVKLHDWNEQKCNHDKPLPNGCRFFKAKRAETNSDHEDGGCCTIR